MSALVFKSQKQPDSSFNALELPYEPEFQESEEDVGNNLRYYWYVVWRRKWAILGLIFAAGLFSGVLAFSAQSIYRSTATLLIGGNEPLMSLQQGQTNRGAAGERYYQRTFFETQIQLLRSRESVKAALARLRQNDPSFDPLPAKEQPRFDWRDWIPRSWRTKMGSQHIPLTGADPDRALLDWIHDSLMVMPVRDTSMLEVSFEDPDPRIAARVANAVAEAYIQVNVEERLQSTQQASVWLREQLEHSKKKIDESVADLQGYREQAGLVKINSMESIYATQLKVLTEQVAKARTERVQAESLYRRAKRLKITGELELLPAGFGNEELERLREQEDEIERKVRADSARFTADYPMLGRDRTELEIVRAQIQDVLIGVVDGIKTEYEMAFDKEKKLEDKVKELEGQGRELDEKEFKADALDRIVQAHRESHNALLKRLTEMATRSADTITQIARIADTAVPSTSPAKPRKGRIIAMAVMFALLGGVGLAFLLDTLDNSLKTREDVQRRLGLQTLATVPLYKTKTRAGGLPVPATAVGQDPHSVFAESIRTIRTVLTLSTVNVPQRIFVVTSTTSGEGKTTVALNLALALGQLTRVLLIEADMRRPCLAKLCGLAPDSPGVVDALAGTGRVAEFVRRIDDTHVLPAGSTIPQNPLELLSSKQFSELLQAASAAYDTVVVDSAPAAAVSDARVLAAQASALIYVIKADSTPYQAARHALIELVQGGAPVIGAVLNGVNLEALGSGAYGRYGGYTAMPYSYHGYHEPA